MAGFISYYSNERTLEELKSSIGTMFDTDLDVRIMYSKDKNKETLVICDMRHARTLIIDNRENIKDKYSCLCTLTKNCKKAIKRLKRLNEKKGEALLVGFYRDYENNTYEVESTIYALQFVINEFAALRD